jgi:hypothetical protein
MAAAAILERLGGLGVTVSVTGDRLRLEPGSRVPAELVKELRAHKKAVISFLELSEFFKHANSRLTGRLQKALADKEKELASRKRDLASSYCRNNERNKEWTKQEITHLETHVAEIQRYIKDGGSLRLPWCCRQLEYICLIATWGFDECIMLPSDCGFSLRFIHGIESG